MGNTWHKFGRTGVLVTVVLLVFTLFTVRLFDWQILQVKQYRELADAQSTDFTRLNAVRGEILDRNGKVMAGNKMTYSVKLVYQKMNLSTGKYDPNSVLVKVLEILAQNGEKWKDELPIKLDADGNYVLEEDRPSEIEYMKSEAMLKVQSYATAKECMNALIERYNCGGYSQEVTRNVASLRYSMTKEGFGLSTPFTIAEDVSQKTIGIINQRISEVPGVETTTSVTRYYGEDGSLAPHLVGYVGAISENQYNKQKEAGNVYTNAKENVEAYTLTDTYGQSGIENVFESQLRGVNGKEVLNLDSNGKIASTAVTQSPRAGNSIHTTIDAKLQKAASQELEKQIKSIKPAKANEVISGAVVAIDLKDFGVLVSANYPTYDINRYLSDNDYLQALYSDEVNKPMFDRAMDGSYTPGSTFKPLVATAALQEGAINLSTVFTCNKYFEKFSYAGYTPSCMGYHGNEDVFGALRDSCNIFFFNTGLELGIEKMAAYAEYFGLGTKTGVEVGEATGNMSNPTEYEENHGASWTEAITIQAAIGQADNSFTPVQLATYAATIANNGVRMKTHFLDKVTDYTGTQVVEQFQPKVLYDANISATTMDAVKSGMRMVATDGTASTLFGNYPEAVAAKTGTAETGDADNLTFITFAPYEKPEIAIAVVIEHGGKGPHAQEVAKAIYDEYFGLNKTEDKPAQDGKSSKTEEEEKPTSSLSPEGGAKAKPGTFYKYQTPTPTPAPNSDSKTNDNHNGAGVNSGSEPSSGAGDVPKNKTDTGTSTSSSGDTESAKKTEEDKKPEDNGNSDSEE